MTRNRVSLLSAVAFAVAAYAAAPAAQAAVVQNVTVPIGGVIGDFCTGEPLSYNGNLHFMFRVTANSNGFHVGTHYNINVDGTGFFSGTKYRGMENINDSFNIGAGLNQTFESRFRLVSQGKSENLWATQKFHITINANGDITVLRNDFSVECRG